MCLILFAYKAHPRYPLILAANRDEFYARPARSAHHWEEAPEIFAGRDLSAGGSWLGVTAGGRFATVTNFAEDPPDEEAPKSRGELVDAFLKSTRSAHDFAHQGIENPFIISVSEFVCFFCVIFKNRPHICS